MRFTNWLHVGAKLTRPFVDKASFQCPNCGQRTLDYQYVANPETRRGYASIWCRNCNHGIRISSATVPDGVDFLPFSVSADVLTKRIPWFTEVVPTGPDDPPGEEFEGEDLPDE